MGEPIVAIENNPEFGTKSQRGSFGAATWRQSKSNFSRK